MRPTILIALATIVYAAPVAEKTKSLAVDDYFPLAKHETSFEHHFNHDDSEVKALHARQFSSNTYNQLTDGTPCRNVTMIYARGSTQDGNVGKASALGPVLFNNLASRIGLSNLTVQGVPYKASVWNFIRGGDPKGSKTMAELIKRAASQCPKTKIVISGYSQGAQLVHRAARNLNATVTERVTAAVTFGFPKKPVGKIPSSRTLSVCRRWDLFCCLWGRLIIPIVLPAHQKYQKNAPAAADWIAARVKS
ncbi:hypothetical protein IL306_004408 [Fusarium sp. DS 682]|nr:hypothetical protein IL306_004408 [Fusarium sp. DS 682]